MSLTGAILNADLAGSIAYSKLALTGAILNADLAGSIAYSKLSLTGAILNADLAGSIAYSKLTLTGSIVNADVNASAAIAYSKLALTGSIVNADVNASAAIAYSKLALSASIATGDLASGLLVPITKGGTGQITANAALNALLPDQSASAGKLLSTDGSNTSWASAASSTLTQFFTDIGNGSNSRTATNTNLVGDVKATTTSQTYAVTSAAPGVFTVSGHGFATGDKAYVTATQNGFTLNTTYYVHKIDANTFHLSTTYANAVAGTGITSSGTTAGTIVAGGLSLVSGVRGTITNDSATAGYVGEYKETITGATSQTDANGYTVASLTLTAGDWDVTGIQHLSFGSAVLSSGGLIELYLAISGNTGGTFTGETAGSNCLNPKFATAAFTTNSRFTMAIPAVRVQCDGTNLYINGTTYSSTTAVILHGQLGTYTSGTATFSGRLSARRVR